MPYQDRDAQRKYQREWIARRRSEWFADKVCELCGSGTDLELDHIDPTQKVSHSIWSWSAARRAVELAKCRALCSDCHLAKSKTERLRGEESPASRHTVGTVCEVRRLHDQGLTSHQIASRMQIPGPTVRDILSGRTWKHLRV